MPSYQQIVDGLSAYPHRLFRVIKWRESSSVLEPDVREEVTELADADIITSAIVGRCDQHTIMLDLDCPHTYVPSTTPGHGHLFIDVPVAWVDYVQLLGKLADMGVIEPGYANVTRARGWSSLRLPWVRKTKEIETEAAF